MSEKKHLVFIINPNSGTDRDKAIAATIEQTLDLQQFSYEIQDTRYAKHGIELAATAAKNGAFAVVAVGGDGSVNDVVAGIKNTATNLAIIPRGSGNGLARALKLPLNDVAAIQVINKCKTLKIDLGYAGERLFLSNAGVGFDALIARQFSKSKKRGLAIYSWLVAKNIWTYKEKNWEIEIDGTATRERAFMICVANGPQFGYNFKIAPQADVTDGLLDVIIVRRFPKAFGGALVLRALNGTFTRSPYVKHYRAKSITIKHPDLGAIQTDGDPHLGDNSIHFRVDPAAQQVIVP